jgi:uncharacterized lipoprotein YddW (UPF0748 family)
MKTVWLKSSSLLLCCALTLQAQCPIAATNPAGTLFPGGRGEDQLVVYTDSYGKSTTGTNEYGVEAIANADHVVTSVGGNNSPIRKGDVILSGHGKGRDWILENVRPGAKLVLQGNQATVRYDAESVTYLAKIRLKELRDKMSKMKTGLTAGERKKAAALLIQATQLAAEANAACVPLFDDADYAMTVSPGKERRGLWHRPTERTAAEVDSTVKKFADAGFNMLFVETIWRGETIYPGSITKQKEYFVGFDPLRAFILSGKKYGVEIHAWVHTFFVGYQGRSEEQSVGPILTQHPEWALVKRNGEKVSSAEKGYLFVCPARPAVQDYIASLYKEIRSSYPGVAGLHLDYIRYPVNSSLEESSCYCDYCRHEFQKLSGVDPKEISPGSDPKAWKRWLQWKEDRITAFVRRVRAENPGTVLSAAVFPNLAEARERKMQNWNVWAHEGIVDFLAPMVYSADAGYVADALGGMRSLVGRRFPLYAGLAPFLKLTPAMMLRQIEAARCGGSAGIILFATQSITDEQLHLFRAGVFRNRGPALSSTTQRRSLP